jgi:hypothetical protein
MKKIICMLGIRRSGNSPLRNWLADQFPDTKVYLNATPDVLNQIPSDRNVVISFEEMPVELLADIEHTCVLLLRDPFNLWASRIKHYAALSSKKQFISPMVTKLWLNHAKAFVKPEGFIPVNHQSFFTDEAYRRTLSESIDGTFSDESLSFVDDNGQGSSFDGLEFDGIAQDMPIFDRWMQYSHLDCFRELFTKEVCGLSTRIFGEGSWKELYS